MRKFEVHTCFGSIILGGNVRQRRKLETTRMQSLSRVVQHYDGLAMNIDVVQSIRQLKLTATFQAIFNDSRTNAAIFKRELNLSLRENLLYLNIL